MIRFSKEKVLLLHKIMTEATGGGVGVRDEALLDSALEGVFAGFGDQRMASCTTRNCWHGSLSIINEQRQMPNERYLPFAIWSCGFLL